MGGEQSCFVMGLIGCRYNRLAAAFTILAASYFRNKQGLLDV